MAIRLRKHGRSAPNSPPELPGAEQAVLEIIARVGAVTVPHIARERSTSRQNIQILVDRLVAQGRVELSSNPAHKRSVLVQLTRQGKLLLEEGVSSQKPVLARLSAGLSQSEVRSTLVVLQRIQELLGAEITSGEKLSSPTPGAQTTRINQELLEAPNEDETGAEEFPVNLL